jgi:hypothetical protein
MAFYKANTEMNKLTRHQRSKVEYVNVSYGILGTVLTVDDADSPLRIESLYGSSHVALLLMKVLWYMPGRAYLSAGLQFTGTAQVGR